LGEFEGLATSLDILDVEFVSYIIHKNGFSFHNNYFIPVNNPIGNTQKKQFELFLKPIFHFTSISKKMVDFENLIL